ncbi:MAG: PAS domain S-box protein [Chitinivibrionales bacterium]|nr:PAS domain S-box protein [Chitinivibrionales bacterium]MBD3396113.1 PAS domain S-box protein [Chitinivibrionales bacterium]
MWRGIMDRNPKRRDHFMRTGKEPSVANEERIRALLENSAYGYAELNREGVILWGNEKAAEIVGEKPEAATGKHFGAILHPDDVERASKNLRARLDRKIVSPEQYRILTRTGEIRHVEVSTQLLMQGADVAGLQAILLDITARKRAEQTLQETQANLAALIENTDGTIWSVDTSYRFLAGNALFMSDTQTGLGRRFAVGESVLPDTIPDDSRREWREYYDRALRGEGFSVEVPRRFGDPTKWMEFSFRPIKNTAGSIVGVSVFGRDITGRKQAEQAILLRERELQRTLEGNYRRHMDMGFCS